MAYTTLISVQDLAAQTAGHDVCIFDCRHDLRNGHYGPEAYAQGHIPGAQFVHLDQDLSGVKTGRNGRHPLPDRAAFLQAMAARGVGTTTQVVAYDNEGSPFAARLWWMLRWLGHESVAVLDGGWSAWCDAGLPVSQDTVTVTPQALPERAPLAGLWSLSDVRAHLHSPEVPLLDARAPDRFRGENETLDPVGGHIPGAMNRFFQNNLHAGTRLFRAPEALRAEFAQLLQGRSPECVVHSCGSGVTACHNLLAMEYAGLSGSRLYAGSWSEWCNQPDCPVAVGE